MRLLDLEPLWLLKDGKRVGFVFRNPVRAKWCVSCFLSPTSDDEQEQLIEEVLGPDACCQQCNPTVGWSIVAGNPSPELASFETISITPSLDGGPGFWHGHITKGEIVGGI